MSGKNSYDITEVNIDTKFNDLGKEQQAQVVGGYVDSQNRGDSSTSDMFSVVLKSGGLIPDVMREEEW